MLLTSAQVSVAISSTVVSIFTVTLFLSGYVLQQRTVNNIREAIRPKGRPIHTFVIDEALPESTTPPVVTAGDGVPVIVVTETTRPPNEGATPVPIPSTITTSTTVAEEENIPQEHVDQQEPPPAADGPVDEDMPMKSSRIWRASQVENNKKDKEWAVQQKKKEKEKKRKGKEPDIPWEEMTTAQRRKQLKAYMAVQEGQQPADPRAYRPRRKLW